MASVIRGSDNFDSLLAKFDAGHNFATNGYQKLSNGLIIQWGVTNLGSGGGQTITFHTAFTTACLWGQGWQMGADKSNNLGFVSMSDLQVGQITNINPNGAGDFCWIVIGY